MMIVEIFLICVLFIAQSTELNNGLGMTPQMGKNILFILFVLSAQRELCLLQDGIVGIILVRISIKNSFEKQLILLFHQVLLQLDMNMVRSFDFVFQAFNCLLHFVYS